MREEDSDPLLVIPLRMGHSGFNRWVMISIIPHYVSSLQTHIFHLYQNKKYNRTMKKCMGDMITGHYPC